MPTFNSEATMGTVRQLFDKAQMNHGWTLMPTQVRSLVLFIQQLDATLTDAFAKNDSVDEITNMLAAYVNEYGDRLYNELLAVEGEVIDADAIEEEDRFTNEGGRVDAQIEEQE